MPAHNPDFKGEKMKKKVAKKGTPRAKKPSGRRKAPSKKPFRLEYGKKYFRRDGLRSGFLAKTTKDDSTYWMSHPYWDPKHGVSYTEAGYEWHNVAEPVARIYDLIREVPPPKSPKGRGK